MMKCPECGEKEPYTTVKCECGYVFPILVRKKEERRLADGDRSDEPATLGQLADSREGERYRDRAPLRKTTADRYPALRTLATLYRVFAAGVFLLGVIRIVIDLKALFSADASLEAKAAASGFVVAMEVAVTGIAFITCYAVGEVIRLLFEINDRVGRKTSA